MKVLSILIIIVIYMCVVFAICSFFKCASKLANEYDEEMEREYIIKKLNNMKK